MNRGTLLLVCSLFFSFGCGKPSELQSQISRIRSPWMIDKLNAAREKAAKEYPGHPEILPPIPTDGEFTWRKNFEYWECSLGKNWIAAIDSSKMTLNIYSGVINIKTLGEKQLIFSWKNIAARELDIELIEPIPQH